MSTPNFQLPTPKARRSIARLNLQQLPCGVSTSGSLPWELGVGAWELTQPAEHSSSTTSGAPSSSGKTMEVVNPATEEVIAEVPAADRTDVDPAVAAARAALDGPWSDAVGARAGAAGRQLGERLMERADEVARLETLHNGKPISESRHIEIPAAAECFEYFGGWSDKVMGETIPVKGNHLTYTLREPVGVVAAIVPWNFPLLLAAWKVAPALACGNVVILKPASQTPLTALALGELARGGRAAAGRAQRDHRARARRSGRRSSSIPASTRSRSPATPAPASGSCGARRRR